LRGGGPVPPRQAQLREPRQASAAASFCTSRRCRRRGSSPLALAAIGALAGGSAPAVGADPGRRGAGAVAADLHHLRSAGALALFAHALLRRAKGLSASRLYSGALDGLVLARPRGYGWRLVSRLAVDWPRLQDGRKAAVDRGLLRGGRSGPGRPLLVGDSCTTSPHPATLNWCSRRLVISSGDFGPVTRVIPARLKADVRVR
jgi:hypothetical protein